MELVRVHWTPSGWSTSVPVDGQWEYQGTVKHLWLRDVYWVVDEEGRQRMLREGQKTRHAFAIGFRSEGPGEELERVQAGPVFYDPYLDGEFRWAYGVVRHTDFAFFEDSGYCTARNVSGRKGE